VSSFSWISVIMRYREHKEDLPLYGMTNFYCTRLISPMMAMLVVDVDRCPVFPGQHRSGTGTVDTQRGGCCRSWKCVVAAAILIRAFLSH
jgi:hypothetical protein